MIIRRILEMSWHTPAAAILALILAGSGVGCSSKPSGAAAKPAAPASVAKLPTEADLVVVTLKPEAETRLGIAAAAIERKPMNQALTLGGDVVIPPGRSSIVSSPQTGTLVAADQGINARPGTIIKEGQLIFTLLPILSADRAMLSPVERVNFEALKADAEGQLQSARPQYKQAKENRDRLEQLVRTRDASAASLADARNAYDQAKATLDAAEGRWAIFQKALSPGMEDAGKLAPLSIRAPSNGVLINVNVQPGQQVTAGSVLFEVANLNPVYVKVPVFVGEEEGIAPDRDAAIGGLADAPGRPTKPGKPVQTTPSANALNTTIDLYYEVENGDGKLRPGQKVGVTIPLKGEVDSLTVPKAAILRDMNGGAWVYESLGKHAFARRRVIVTRVIGTAAVLALGPKPGALIVTDGAAELFGTEFGGGK